jgi:uncharacterized protein
VTSTERPARPRPVPTELSAPHWEGCRHGSLLVQQCESCATYVSPPEPFCPGCLADQLTWQRSSGKGEVHSYSVVWRPGHPAFEVPYTVVVVRLSEGWHMMSNLIACPPDEVNVGMPVEVAFEEAEADLWLPFFRPSASASSTP